MRTGIVKGLIPRSVVERAARTAMAVLAIACGTRAASAASILFDASHHEMAGNADWVIDADAWDLSMPAYPCTGSSNEANPSRFPTPAQAGITPATAETYWKGGVSAWAVELAKAGHAIETLPPGGLITFGDGTNPQDLSYYALFVVVEPQAPFTVSEKAAILAFVSAGGGLFMVGDHETSDRDCDGWDSPHVWNDLTGATSSSAAGVFGIWMRVNGLEDQGGEDWFDEAIDSNVSADAADPIIHGPFGSGAGGLGLFGSTSMDLNPADNATVAAHVWRNGQAHGNQRVTFATAIYGNGRVAAIGDSSPADDGTGDTGDSLHPGWDKASGGVANREIHLNACAWLLNPPPDLTPPAITSGPQATPFDCSASLTWTTDEAATSVVDYGPTSDYGATVSAPGFVQSHVVALMSLAPDTDYHFRVSSSDAAGNGPTQSSDATFTTTVPAPPVITSGPSAASIGARGATIVWTTDEASTSEVLYGLTPSYGASASAPGLTTSHAVVLSGLTPQTTYHASALSTDACTNGPAASTDVSFTTAPDSIDLSGWSLRQYNSAQTFPLPAGTSIAANGYLVIGRDATPSEFLAAHPSMPAGTLYLNSNANGSCSAGCFPLINGGESFDLRNAAATVVDGPTVSIAAHTSEQRLHPGDPAGSTGSWSVTAESFSSPGTGAGTGSGSGVRINEFSDAPDYTREFIELYYDANGAPDTVPPAAITDLIATPLTSSTIRLTWTATGDDGTTGIATAYDLRYATSRIQNEADFAAATPVTGEPLPLVSGSAEAMVVGSLAADTAYFFAMKVGDEAANVSGRSNFASATSGVPGSGASHLVISQLQIGGTTDDAVEIYNPTAASISLSGFSIQYLAANGNFGFRVNLTGANSIPAFGCYLVAGNGYLGPPARDDSMGTSNMSATGGHALLVAKLTNVIGCSDTAIVDKVGYGASATCPEGGAGKNTSVPAGGASVSRKPGGSLGAGQDTDINSDDFLAPQASAFRNRSSAPANPPSSLGNVKNTLFLSKGASGEQLDWARALGATGYQVYLGTSPGFMAAAPAPWQTPAAPPLIDATDPAPILFYVVKATDGLVESSE